MMMHTSIALQGDKIIVAGYTANYLMALTLPLPAIRADGILDSSFGENGKVITDFNSTQMMKQIQ